MRAGRRPTAYEALSGLAKARQTLVLALFLDHCIDISHAAGRLRKHLEGRRGPDGARKNYQDVLP